MKSKTGLNILLTVCGVAIFCIGGYALVTGRFGEATALAGVMIGVGSGLFGHNLGALVRAKAIQSNPVQARKVEIEQKDERNIAIGNAAKSKAFDAMGYIYGVVMLIFVLLNVDMVAILLIVGAYLLVYGNMIYHLTRLSKEM